MNIIFDINNLFRLVEMTLGRDAETKRWDETLRRNAGTRRSYTLSVPIEIGIF